MLTHMLPYFNALTTAIVNANPIIFFFIIYLPYKNFLLISPVFLFTLYSPQLLFIPVTSLIATVPKNSNILAVFTLIIYSQIRLIYRVIPIIKSISCLILCKLIFSFLRIFVFRCINKPIICIFEFINKLLVTSSLNITLMPIGRDKILLVPLYFRLQISALLQGYNCFPPIIHSRTSVIKISVYIIFTYCLYTYRQRIPIYITAKVSHPNILPETMYIRLNLT